MKRTQIDLDDALHARLTALALRQGRSLSELVRAALAKAYGADRDDERRSSLKAPAVTALRLLNRKHYPMHDVRFVEA